MSDEHKSSLIGFHAFTGNECIFHFPKVKESMLERFKEEQHICQSHFIPW